MALVQEAYDIPTEIWTKILTGEYKRIGGVVRHAVGERKGEIVKHLKPMDLPTAKQSQSLGVKALHYVKNNKKALIVLGAGTGIALAGSGVYYKVKNHEQFNFRLSSGDLSILVNLIHEYTAKLAQDNSVEIKSEALSTMDSSDNDIIYLKQHLEAQKHIFEKAE